MITKNLSPFENVVKSLCGIKNSAEVFRLSRRFLSSTRLSLSSDHSSQYDYTSEQFKFLKVTPQIKPYVHLVQLNRVDKKNAINLEMWDEICKIFDILSSDPKCRSVVLSSVSSHIFTSGIDLNDLSSIGAVVTDETLDIASKHKKVLEKVRYLQKCFTSLEHCCKPVIASICGPCVGAGVDLITAADIRLCSQDAWFQVKEVDMGLAADVGTLQRLPKVIGNQSLVREWCLTARKIDSNEASASGLVSRVIQNSDSNQTEKTAIDLAQIIAEKSPVAVQGTKLNLNFARDHTVDEGLEFVARHNATMLQSKDLMASVMAAMTKEKAQFQDL